MANNGRVKVGIIGSRFEGEIHAESFRLMPDEAEVVAIASPTPGNTRRMPRLRLRPARQPRPTLPGVRDSV